MNLDKLVSLHNEQRVSKLKWSNKLARSTYLKATRLMKADCFDHFCGQEFQKEIDEVKYLYVFAGENIAEDFQTEEGLMRAWLKSPTHRSNILNENFNEIGIAELVGKYHGKENNNLIVVHFGQRKHTILDKLLGLIKWKFSFLFSGR
jgi:uncharacterized protein YkwD